MLVDRARHPDRPGRRGRRHLRHRQLPGRRADRRVGQGQARPGRPRTAKIAMLDLNANQVSVDVQRDQGFLKGFGIDVADENKIGDENDPRIVGHDVTDGAEEGGQHRDGEPAPEGPGDQPRLHDQRARRGRRLPGAQGRGQGRSRSRSSRSTAAAPASRPSRRASIGATSQQYPLKMAQQGVEAVAAFAKDGTKPQATAGKTSSTPASRSSPTRPQSGVDSKDTAFGLQNCWG